MDVSVGVYIRMGECMWAWLWHQALQRLMKRNGFSQEEAQKRFDSQPSPRQRMPKCHVLISTEGSIDNLQLHASHAWDRLLSRRTTNLVDIAKENNLGVNVYGIHVLHTRVMAVFYRPFTMGIKCREVLLTKAVAHMPVSSSSVDCFACCQHECNPQHSRECDFPPLF